jgi:hypothetical protein
MLIQWHHGSGDFATAANWDPASVPGSSDDAKIDAAGTYTVTTSVNETVNSLSTVATATLAITAGSVFTANDGTGSGVNAGTIAIDNGSEFDFDGTEDNTGKITVNASSTATSLFIGATAGTLTGGGKITLSDNGDNLIFIADSTLTNANNTIAGAGELTGIDCYLVNEAEGVIDASGTHNALVLNTGSNAISNAGILETTGLGGLQIESAVDNASTGVIAATGANFIVGIEDGAVVTGGTLKTASGGAIDVGGATFDGSTPAAPVSNDGNVMVEDGNTLTLLGTIDNIGTITLDSVGDPTDLAVGPGGVALQGGGKIKLTNDNDLENTIAGLVSSDTLTNVNNTITGSGQLGDGHMTLINEAKGVIDATAASSFPSFILDTGNDISNAGLIEATAGGSLQIAFSTIDNTPTGLIQASGTNSIVSVQNNSIIVGGILKTASGGAIVVGSATFDGSTPAAPVSNDGNVVVEDEATLTLLGTIDNSGTITLASTGDPTKLLIGAGGAALEGGGKLALTNDIDEISGAANSDTLTNVDNTISGGGIIDATLVNEAKGVIDGTASNGSLVIATTEAIINAGVLEGAPHLAINTSTVDNTATGIIEATGANSYVVLDEDVIVGGTLKTVSGGTIFIENSNNTFDGSTPAAPLSIAGNVVVKDDATLTLLGTIDNSGTITLASTGDPTELLIGAGGAALKGGGKLTLTNDIDEINGAADSDTLTNVDNTISGGGYLGAGQLTLVNETKGVIDATGILKVETGSNEIVNAGLLETTTADGVLSFASGLVNTGTIKSDSAAGQLDTAAITNNGKLLAANGVLGIFGPISGNGSATIDNGGQIWFGSETGTTQNVTFANNGSANATLLFMASATANPSLIYDGTISGFSTTKDRIDFTNLTFTGNTTPTKQLVNGNTVLTITEGADSVSVTLAGNEMANHFTVSQDNLTGTLIVDPPVDDSNHAIANGTKLTIATAAAGTETLAGSSGALVLDDSVGFAGTVAEFGGQDALVLSDMTFGANTTLGYSENSTNTGGTLTVSDGTQTAKIALLGNYMASSFVAAGDGHGGTLITEAAQSASHHASLSTPHAA